jgi:hypothetical protein
MNDKVTAGPACSAAAIPLEKIIRNYSSTPRATRDLDDNVLLDLFVVRSFI